MKQKEKESIRNTHTICNCFFFSSRRRHTRFDCDWSSDVCSSDLLKHNPSGRLYGLPKILWYARKIHRCRILLLGTVKPYRMSGVDALMYHWIWTKGAIHGYHWGEGGWILEDNVPMVNGALQLGFHPS